MFFRSLFSFFLTWWGAFLMGALDSSMLMFLPFGMDALVIYLAARNRDLFWVYPLLAAAGSVAGAVVTFWIGQKAGEEGLERLVAKGQLERIRERVRGGGAVAMAMAALLPPPFPLTPVILTSGALEVDRWRFFMTFGAMRLLRFGVESVLARRFGRGILRILESDTFQWFVIGFIALAIIGTTVSAIVLWRRTRGGRVRVA